jgi:hypothetical protein
MQKQGFTNEELVSILQSLKSEGVSSFNQSHVKAEVYNKITSYEAASRKPVLLSFNRYMNVFKPVMALLAVTLLGYGGFQVAANISPLSPLYTLRNKVDNISLSILPADKKIEKQFDIANDKLAAIKQVNVYDQQVAKISESVKQDLNQLSTDIQNIKDPKKVLALSKTLEDNTTALRNETNLNPSVTTSATLPSDIKDTIKQTTSEILAVVYNAEEKSDNCSKYVEEKITALTVNPDMTIFNPTKYSEIVSLLKDAKNKIENNDCLGALASLDIVESYKLNIVINPADLITTKPTK